MINSLKKERKVPVNTDNYEKIDKYSRCHGYVVGRNAECIGTAYGCRRFCRCSGTVVSVA